jgi:glycosyltransferase involved in cell wall biosynthesis
MVKTKNRMKIAFIGQKKAPEKLAAGLIKLGHKVFTCDKNNKFSVFHILFSKYDIIHLHPSVPVFEKFILKILKIKSSILEIPVPFGVSTRPVKSFDYLSRWNLRKGDYILFANRLTKSNGAHKLIEVFKNLEDKHLTRNKKLVISGDTFSSKNYTNQIKDTSRGREKIIFTEALNGEALREIFSHAYFFIDLSRPNELSENIAEAMGYGKAVLAFNSRENREALDHDNGILFKNPNDLENKLVYLINEPILVKAMGENSLKKARNEYSWENVARKIQNLYEEVLLRKRKNLIFKIKYGKIL